MNDNFDWSGAPEGERWVRWSSMQYVLTANRGVIYKDSRQGWIASTMNPIPPLAFRCLSGFVRVQDDLHPLVPGQQAITWADERLRDPEVAGWTEAYCQDADLIVHGPRDRFYTARGGVWVVSNNRSFSWLTLYRSAVNTNNQQNQENDVTTDQQTETLEQFKARVYTVGKAAAVEHSWCSVFDRLMDELGIEAPKPKWPAPGKLFRADGDPEQVLRISTSATHYRYIRDEDGVSESFPEFEFGKNFTSADDLEVLDV